MSLDSMQRLSLNDDATVNRPCGDLNSLPNELLVDDLFPSCDPLSLLQLCRTCKTLRALLLTRSSEHIWRSSRLRIPPAFVKRHQSLPFGHSISKDVAVRAPPLLDGLSEPAYAHLLFEDVCTLCNAEGAEPAPDVGIRVCKECEAKNQVSREQLFDMYPDQRECVLAACNLRHGCWVQGGGFGLYWLPLIKQLVRPDDEDVKLFQRANAAGAMSGRDLDHASKRRSFCAAWAEFIKAQQAIEDGLAAQRGFTQGTEPRWASSVYPRGI